MTRPPRSHTLRARPEVDARAIGVIGQADDAPPALVAAAALPDVIPMVLMAPPGFPGREIFRLEQHELAEVDGRRASELDALDRFVGQISDIVLEESTSFRRAFRLQSLMSSSDVRLPYNAAFPSDERQVHFFASPLWHDRLAFDPVAALGRLHAPVLVLIGNEDPTTPLLPYLSAVRGGLTDARTSDATVCLITGRTRHTFSSDAVEAIVRWLGERVGARATEQPAPPRGCLPDPQG
jgi:hypothetical protein